MRKVLTLFAGAIAAAGATWFIGMRTGWPPVVAMQRRVNRDYVNPRMLKRQGQPGGPTALVHHTGRSSGRSYRTPVGAVPTEDGFVIASVYGTQSDWIRNVLAGGPASMEYQGRAAVVCDPRVVPIDEVSQYFSKADQRAHRLFHVTEAVRLRALSSEGV